MLSDIAGAVINATRAMTGFTTALNGATLANAGLTAATGWAGLILLIGTAINQVIKYKEWLDSAEKAQEDFAKASSELSQAENEISLAARNRKELQETLKVYDELRSKSRLTIEETETWLEVNQKIKDLVPNIAGSYDDVGNFLVDNRLTSEDILGIQKLILENAKQQVEVAKQKAIQAQEERIRAQEALIQDEKIKTGQYDAERGLQESKALLAEYIRLRDEAKAAGDEYNVQAYQDLIDTTQADIAGLELALAGIPQSAELGMLVKELNRMRIELAMMKGEIPDLSWQEALDGTDRAMQEVIPTINDLSDALEQIANSMEGEQRDAFLQFSQDILDLNEAFKEGEISASAYFATLAEKADNADLIGMFEDNTEAAQSFFQALFIEGVEAIATLDTQMQEGKISILEYMDGLQGTGDVLREQYESLLENADAYGLNAEQIADITESYEEMTGALSTSNQELINMRETAELLRAGYDSVMNGTMKPASEEMINYYQQLSQAAWNYAQQSGFAFRNSAGEALTSAEQIYNYLSGGVGNFSNFASQMTARTNLAVQQQRLAVQQSVKALADIIGSFKMNIVAQQEGFTTIEWPVPKIISGIFNIDSFPIRIPNIKISGSASIGNMGAVDTLAGGLSSLVGGGGWTNPDFGNDIWSGGGGYTPPPVNGGGGGGGGGSQEDEERNEAERQYQNLLQMTIAMLKDRAKQAKEALRDELRNYKELINQKKKDLDLMKEQRREQNKVDEAKENITNLEEEIAQLQFDTSEEGIARRLELEEQLAQERRDLEDAQFEQSIEEQQRALDEEYENFEEYINDQIEALDEYLEREGEITQEAMELIHGRTQEFYDELMEWNMTYGSGVAQDVVDAWQGAIVWIDQFAMQGASSVEGFASRAGGAVSGMTAAVSQAAIDAQEAIAAATANMDSAISSTYERLTALLGGWIFTGGGVFPAQNISVPYHSGGFAGGAPTLPESEIYAKLLKGEYVATESEMYNFVHKTLPTIAGSSSESHSIGDININFDVEHLDREVLPDIKNMVTKAINDTLVDAGFKRNPGSFGSV